MNILINKPEILTMLFNENDNGITPVALMGKNVECNFCSYFGDVMLVDENLFACESCLEEVSELSKEEKEERASKNKENRIDNPAERVSIIPVPLAAKALERKIEPKPTLEELDEKINKIFKRLGLDENSA